VHYLSSNKQQTEKVSSSLVNKEQHLAAEEYDVSLRRMNIDINKVSACIRQPTKKEEQ